MKHNILNLLSLLALASTGGRDVVAAEKPNVIIVSTTSRTALLTRCYPRRVSMHINADPKLLSKGRQVLFPVSHKGLNSSEITIAELLKQKGYATACIGK